MVDVPRFELGASSMPRKRASRLRHTPSGRATDDGHLRRMGHAVAWSRTEEGREQQASLRCPRDFLTN